MSPPEVTAIRAELSTMDTCTAAGLTVHARAPVLTMCREMLAAGLDPDSALDVYRNGLLALRIRAIGEAAKLTVEDGRDGVPRFRRWKAPPSVGPTPPMRLGAAALPGIAPDAGALSDETAEVGQ